MQAYFGMFAAYNRWANRRLYDAAQGLSADEFAADRGAFFRSVKGTLNHLLVGDRIWMHRFIGMGPTYARLDLVLFDGFEELRAAREAEDERIEAWVAGLDPDQLSGTFIYRTIVDRREVTQRLIPALAHVFNHQTHHRGQTHALLTGLGREAPSLDLVHFQRATGIGLSA